MNHYFNHAARTPLSPAVQEALLPYQSERSVTERDRLIGIYRQHIAELLQITPAQVHFTTGGTEANKRALQYSFSETTVRHVITSRLEHPSVLRPLEQLEQRGLIRIHYTALDEQGRVILPDLIRLLQIYPQNLLSLMHGNDETGHVLDLDVIASVSQRYRTLFHSDTAQTVGKLSVPLGILDFATASAAKFGGPEGIGLLLTAPNQRGSTRVAIPENVLATENLAGIVGMTKALELSLAQQASRIKYLNDLKSYFIYELTRLFPATPFLGPSRSLTQCLPGLLHVSFPPLASGVSLLRTLQQRGITAANGHIDWSKPANLRREFTANFSPETIRFSMGPDNTFQEIHSVIRILREVYQEQSVLPSASLHYHVF